MPASKRARTDLIVSAVGALISVIVLAIGMILVGQVSGGQAQAMLESMMPTTRFLCSAVMGASATILALMLTMLSLSSAIEDELEREHYRRIRQIAMVATATFIAATGLLCFHSVPFNESGDAPALFYRVVYYTLLGGSALLGGALIAVALMLYFAIRDMIVLHAPGGSSAGLLVNAGDEQERREDQARELEQEAEELREQND